MDIRDIDAYAPKPATNLRRNLFFVGLGLAGLVGGGQMIVHGAVRESNTPSI